MIRKHREALLAQAVARAFKRAGFAPRDLLTGEIKGEYTTLPWQVPPLICGDSLDDAPLAEMLEVTYKVDAHALHDFWNQGLQLLYTYPGKAIGNAGWRAGADVIKNSSANERRLLLSTPEGFPECDDYAGAIFTMEVVTIFSQCVKIDELISDDDTYAVRLPGFDGLVGIVDGLPSMPSPWETSIQGQVQDYLFAGRGQLVTTCRYDLLAKVRAVLHEHKDQFEEFKGLDWALQALGVLCTGRLSAELQRAIEGMVSESKLAARKLVAVDEAIELMNVFSMNDRARLMSLHNTLVPEVIQPTTFQNRIFNLYQTVPVIMAPSTEKKIKTYLAQLRQRFLKEIE